MKWVTLLSYTTKWTFKSRLSTSSSNRYNTNLFGVSQIASVIVRQCRPDHVDATLIEVTKEWIVTLDFDWHAWIVQAIRWQNGGSVFRATRHRLSFGCLKINSGYSVVLFVPRNLLTCRYRRRLWYIVGEELPELHEQQVVERMRSVNVFEELARSGSGIGQWSTADGVRSGFPNTILVGWRQKALHRRSGCSPSAVHWIITNAILRTVFGWTDWTSGWSTAASFKWSSIKIYVYLVQLEFGRRDILTVQVTIVM